MKIAIASGKGGTGKTTLSTNLASYIAQEHNVVLADLDVEEPNSGLFIEARLRRREAKYEMIPEWSEKNCTLCGNCHEVCNFHAIIQLGSSILVFPQLCRGCYACAELCPSSALEMVTQKMGELQHFKNGKLNFIESRLDVGQEQATQLISQTNEYIHEQFPGDIIKIYDSPPGTSCPVIEATKDADYVILVTEPTPFGLHDLKRAYELVKKFNIGAGCIINKSDLNVSTAGKIQDFLEAEDILHISSLPYAKIFTESMTYGQAVIEFTNNDLTGMIKDSWDKIKQTL